MKRDWILIKEMLLALEEDRFSEYLNTIELPKFSGHELQDKGSLGKS